MFLPISGHPQVYNWSLKHTEEEIYFFYISSSVCLKTGCETEDDLR
jgi:hypothetical protein